LLILQVLLSVDGVLTDITTYIWWGGVCYLFPVKLLLVGH